MSTMMERLDVVNLTEGKPSGANIEVPAYLREIRPNPALLHEVVTAYQANERQGTHETLTRGEVSGGGKKPWKQKHTGRARSGSNRSPLWRKGGIVFGPHSRSYRQEVPAFKKKLALAQALHVKLDGQIVVFKEESVVSIERTKELAGILTREPAPKGFQVIVLKEAPQGFKRAARNIPWLGLSSVRTLNALVVLNAARLMISDQAWSQLMEVCCGGPQP